ncbi:hypothetical protein ACFP3T_13500 [Lactiplantibacillus dongliensis]|uniref:Uncharacterized protein n=1 Tax=Lactiplantibacillus dongliensis TaxID=2559919 RepID=A0ABW1R850_9LACO|nr:hypothetical protein [Lactiplantibacillus dongliensis]
MNNTNDKKFEWSIEGDILAVYLHKYQTDGLNHNTRTEYAQLLGTTNSGLKARVRQVTGVDANDPSKGLANPTINTVTASKLLNEVDNQEAWANFINTLWP